MASVVAERNLVLKKLVDKLAEATPVDTGEAQRGWRLEGNKIVNDVEHIGILNEGHSQQAPVRFIEKTILESPGIKPNGVIVRYK